MAVIFKSCSIDGCNGNANRYAKGSKGWCSAHYQRYSKYGDPLSGSTAHGEPRRWIEAHVDYKGEDCLSWPFTRNSYGYPILSDRSKGRGNGAHREMCRLAYGDPPSEQHQAAHTCGNGTRGCVNPMHLRWDTVAGNMADKVRHGTHNRGVRNPKSQLTENQVRKIRGLEGIESVSALARRFGVSRTSIRYIFIRRNWAWLE